MRRTLQINLQTTISILCVVSLAVVQGLPVASRTAPGEPASSRRRSGDDLISGSDFLSMFIGDPTVRSRRFPLLGDASSRQLRPSEGQDVDAHPHRRTNIIDPHERLSGLIRTQDRQASYRLDTHDSHNANKVDLSEDLQRRGSTKFKFAHSIDGLDDHLDAVTELSTTDDVSASEGKIFGDRTLPRTSSNPPSSATTNVPTSVAATDSYSTSDDNSQSSTVINALNNQESTDANEDYTHTNDANLEVTEKLSFSPKFSVSSSIKKFVSRESTTEDSQSNNEEIHTSPSNIDNEVVKEQEDEGRTSSSQTSSTESTTTEEPSTTPESLSEQSGDVTAEPTVTASVEEIPDGVQFQKIGLPQDTGFQVVSVRVSSSVGKKNPALNTILEETAPEYQEHTSKEAGSESVRLESVDHPTVTAIQRSELLVEESSPAEVTAVPFSPYTSFIPSKYQSASTNLYHPPLEHTSPNPQNGAVSYQSSLTPAAARRIHFFNHPPRTYPNPNLEALKRSQGDYSYLKAGIEDGGSRRYASQRVREREYQTLRQEPASVAESIQRSVIARQEADRVDLGGHSRSQFHQDKTVFADGRYQPEEDRKRYNQPERIWGEPEKVYGEPEKVYGEPEKVYGEPEKVYGEPEKVYGEPEKVYGEPVKNYEVDEAVSVLTNGRAHGVQTSQGPAPSDSAIKMIDSKAQDPNHKFGYVVEGRNFRKYRVEERTSDGFIVGEYGVVSHDDGSLRGVRYTADESINPRLIYDTLVKFLSL